MFSEEPSEIDGALSVESEDQEDPSPTSEQAMHADFGRRQAPSTFVHS